LEYRLDLPKSAENMSQIRLLLAIFTRELKTAFFLALSDESNIQIRATASNTAELLTFNRSLQPNVIVLEWDLPGRPMTEVYPVLTQADSPPAILIIGKPSSEHHIRDMAPDCDLFTDPEDLIHALKAQ
jgi:DNA-binding NarL/FixJ family response regulator